jgi:hypothetical protein
MQMLPENQREALILIGAGGFSYEEAAEMIGVAVGTVKSRVSRARADLVQIFETGNYERDGKPVTEAMDSMLRRWSVWRPDLIPLSRRKAGAQRGARAPAFRTGLRAFLHGRPQLYPSFAPAFAGEKEVR